MPDTSFMRIFSNRNEEEIGLGGKADSLTELTESFVPVMNEITAKVVEDYFRYGMDLNQAIAKEAAARTLNDEQIKRILESVNQQVYLNEYNKKRSDTERIVEFPLASFDKIKALIDGDIPPIIKDAKSASKSDGNVEKTASDNASELSFLNYRTHKSVGLAESSPPSEARLNAIRIAEKLAELEDEYNEALANMETSTGRMAEALVKYAKVAYYEPQYLFKKVCTSAQLTKQAQLCVQDAYSRHVKALKEGSAIHDAFPSGLELVDAVGVDPSPFSLGERSLLKQAEKDAAEEVSVPQIVLSDKTLMKDYNKLVELAIDIQKRQETLSKAQSDRKRIMDAMPEKLKNMRQSKGE